MVRQRYLDPFCDFGFKRLFASRANTCLLEDFLRSVFGAERSLPALRQARNELQGNRTGSRTSIFDIHCMSEDGEAFIVEFQRVKQPHYISRSIYYTAACLSDQGTPGKWDYNLKPVCMISILGFRLDIPSAYCSRHIVLAETAHCVKWSDLLSMYYIEMPAFRKQEHELESRLDQWLYVLANMRGLEKIPLSLKNDPVFERVFATAELSNLNDAEMNAFIESQKQIWDEYCFRETALQEGKKEGKQNALLDVARRLKNEHFSITDIARITGLSAEMLADLQ